MLSTPETPLPKRVARRQAPLRHHRRWTEADGIRVLRRLYGPEAQFRSPTQERLINTILDGAGQIIGILGTGEGKSLSFMLPSQLPGAGTTVVILPLVALKQDQIRQCHDMNIECHVWSRGSDAEEIRHPLIFVAMEQATQASFKRLLLRLDMSNSLDGIIFDESHLVVTASSYRPRFRFLKALRELRCQFIFLTATLPPTMMTAFQQELLLVNPHVIRSSTIRKDLNYHVIRSPILDLQAYAVEMVQRFLQEPWVMQDERARVIVYTLTRKEADAVAEALDGLRYYSDSGSVEEKAAALQQWVDGVKKIVVATSAFGVGVNYAHVRGVFHIGMPDNVIDFAQEVGRAGRDGQGGISGVFLKLGQEVWTGQANEDLLPVAVRAMRAYLGEPRCRAAVLSDFLDQATWHCRDPDVCCDRCQKEGLLRDGEGECEGGGLGWRIQEEEDGVIAGGEDEDEESDESSEREDLEVGALMLRQHVRDEERGQRQYIAGLVALQGRCVICWLDQTGGRAEGMVGESTHRLDQCRNPQKYLFFDAKRKAITKGAQRFGGKGGERQGWLMDYAACFRCGNPQAICPQQGKGQCQHQDVVFPVCWVVFQWEQWRRQELGRLAGQEFQDEAEYMLWLGLKTMVYGLEASNAMKVTDWVIHNCLR